MIRIVVITSIIVFFAACEAQASDGEVSPVPMARYVKAQPIISVRGSEIRVNDMPVWLGDTLDTWKRILGGSPTCYDTGLIDTCVWHSNGLLLGTSQFDKTRVKFIKIHVNIEPPELGERSPSWPNSPFQGSLELDGIPVQADTEFRDLRRQVAPARELRCGGSDCGNPSAAFSPGANIYMNLAGRSESSRILRFSISCSSTESCLALMPKKGNM